MVTYELFVEHISPEIGSIRGGNVINIYGGGFRYNLSLKVGLMDFYQFNLYVILTVKTAV